ncbi:SMP-30/gluconolactonase/LRE family protein [Roseiconus lacunae]|uniref:SMP-30/gluconolactonase/LRE family protein n=1 Tax=Roseiconus lacunae TaxID=2605694 RepID=A0ABT7PPI8_9BACT|nr:SMP-30/gluconolactonase/LRE family protein [Roseiconus lacunae]MCD0458940.1 SMP-30/gluconolactonase/LRE family protein [Roseiconus lacunae]MDM4018381.1 SMP-30/gluconolactonase/LRE family protein [Roseiconus lacunae]
MRKLLCFLGLAATCVGSILSANAQTPSTIGRIEILAPEMEQYVDAGTKIEVLAGGFTWTEGPVWVSDDSGGHLLFSDIPRNTIFRWSAAKGIEEFMSPSGYTGVSYYGLEPGSNGLTLDSQGRLTMCEHGDRRVSVLTRGGGKQTLVDAYQGKRLNSPNDLVFDQAGNLYFTDPPYGLPERADDPRRELDFCGVYRLDRDGQLQLLTQEMTRPNGIGLSPDESTLYIAQSDPQNPIWKAFPISDGKLGPGKVLHDAKSAMKEFPGLPDGMTVAKDGTLFASGPGGIYVISPAGKLLGRILTEGRVSNCSFDSDQKFLYMTADKFLCRVSLK